MTGECDHCGDPACDGLHCHEPCACCGRDHCDGRCEPRDDEPDDCLNCGVCEDCIQRSIDAEGEELASFNAAFDEWDRLTNREREERIRRAIDQG